VSTQVKESYFWSQVKAGLTSAEVDLCRIENTAGSGISDVNACCGGREIWIELKVFHGNRLYFRNSQRAWIVRRGQVGGRVFILARRDDEILLYRAIDIVVGPHTTGSDGKSFSVAAEDLPLPIFRGAKPFKWNLIRAILFKTD
jgi:hypothetical protein